MPSVSRNRLGGHDENIVKLNNWNYYISYNYEQKTINIVQRTAIQY